MNQLVKIEKKKIIKYNIKAFTRWREVLIGNLYNRGVLFFGVDINLTEYWDESKKNRREEGYTTNEAFELVERRDIASIKELLGNLDMTEMAYVTVEPHLLDSSNLDIDNRSLGYPHIHILLGVRSLIGSGSQIKTTILTELLRGGYEDIDVNELLTEQAISEYFSYIVKRSSYAKNGIGKAAFRYHYLYTYNYINEAYAGLQEWMDQLNTECREEDIVEFGDWCIIEHRHKGINGVNKKHSSDKYILVNLWRIFMEKVDIFNCNGKLYQKNFESKYSYNLLGNLSILKEKIIDIFDVLNKLFYDQLKHINFMELMNDYFDAAVDIVYNNPKILPTKEIMFNLIEFRDGIYNINSDMFLKYSDKTHQILLKELSSNLTCIKYYRLTYHNIQKPIFWLKKMEEQLGSKEKIKDFCISFSGLFHCNLTSLEILKKNAVMVLGEDTAIKRLLLSEVLLALFGKDNVGIINNSFNFDQIENNVAIIVTDEFTFDQNRCGKILKLLEKKPILLLSNKKKNEVETFLNRISIYNFIKSMQVDYQIFADFQKKIQRELPRIIIHCNRLFVKKYFLSKRIRMSNNRQKMLEKIKKFW